MKLIVAPRSTSFFTYDEAVLYCTFCRHNGYTDWRLPTKKEREHLGLWGWHVDRNFPTTLTVTPVRLNVTPVRVK